MSSRKSRSSSRSRSRSSSRSKSRSRSRSRSRSPYDRRRRGDRHGERDRDRDHGRYGRRRSPGRRKTFRVSQQGRDSTTLFIGNLPYHIRQSELQRIVEKVGPIRNVKIGANRRTGESRGYAFVCYESREDAETAFEKFRNYNLDGRTLRIDWDAGLDRKLRKRSRSRSRSRSASSRSRSRSRSRSHSRSK